MQSITTLKLSKETKAKLYGVKKFDETYEELLERILSELSEMKRGITVLHDEGGK